jgi:hypothetical protein
MYKFTTDFSGQVDVTPRLARLNAPLDSLSTITTAGYINSSSSVSINPPQVGDFVFAIYNGGQGLFTVTITAGIATLVPWVDGGNVLLPVVVGDVPVFNSTSGQLKDSGAKLSLSSNAWIATTAGALTAGHIAQYSDANGTLTDSGIVASNVMSKAAVNAMAAGSSIVLAKINGTESSNLVTASGVAGVITTSALTTAGAGNYVITWTNTFITTTSVIGLTILGGTNSTQNMTFKCVPGAGSAVITIYNNTASTALNGTIFLGYNVF